jgi:catechol 2,3-dioxygenase-like lactoylglutathione lyase family enzyme
MLVRVTCAGVLVGTAELDNPRGLSHALIETTDGYAFASAAARRLGREVAATQFCSPRDGDFARIAAERWDGDRLALEDRTGRELQVSNMVLLEGLPGDGPTAVRVVADFRLDGDHARPEIRVAFPVHVHAPGGPMLKDKDATATIAVKDIERARTFYRDVVGLTPMPASEPGALPFKSGNSEILVYQSDFAGTNKATSATWMVDDELEATVRTLREKGVAFEHYDDLPGTTRSGDVHVAGNSKAAWFKDPDGNIIAIVGR